MASNLVLFALVTTILVVQGANGSFRKFLNREDQLPKQLPQNVVEAFITQRLDNFDPTNDATWQQRYLLNGEFWAPGGCIFILLTGAWEVSPDRFQNTMMYAMSREFHCYMALLEHRYYGQSHPTEDTSNQNLRYLNVEQALADIAHFVEHIKSESVTPGATNSPVVVLGRRYAGSLSIWFRQSYPFLTVGAYSSSSPMESVVDHFQYKELAGAVYRHIGGDECYNRIEGGFAAMEQMISNGQNEDLADMFHLCYELKPQDVQFFFQAMSDYYSSLTQFERATDISEVCNAILSNGTQTAVESLAQFIIDRLDGQCIDLDYEKAVDDTRQTNWNDSAVVRGDRQWMYQQCTQLGWFHSSRSRFQPFGSNFPVGHFFQFCADIFGDLYSPDLSRENSVRFNTAFGGLTPNVSNVLYINGQLDPWRTVGIQNDDSNESVVVIVIEGASQSSDIAPITEDDSDAVVAAKEAVIETISGWIRAAQEV